MKKVGLTKFAHGLHMKYERKKGGLRCSQSVTGWAAGTMELPLTDMGKLWEESISGKGTWGAQVYTYWTWPAYWRAISETSHRYVVCLMVGSSRKRPGLDIHKLEYRMRWPDDRVLTGKKNNNLLSRQSSPLFIQLFHKESTLSPCQKYEIRKWRFFHHPFNFAWLCDSQQ